MTTLCIAANHVEPHHTGGSEKIVRQVAESMVRDFGFTCHLLPFFSAEPVVFNDVIVHKPPKQYKDFVKYVNDLNPNHFMVYSDCFGHWSSIVKNPTDIKCHKSIALVGMTKMKSHTDQREAFLNHRNEFQSIVHSDCYDDYYFCKENNLNYRVINNFVDVVEFSKPSVINFRKKYAINTPNMILCVSNFFPGKGQENLYFILDKLYRVRKDFTAVFICSHVNFFLANKMMNDFVIMLKRASFPNKILIDISREETVQAFKEADVFAFPSQKEVAPLVVMESMICGVPWVALPVGNIPSLSGGLLVKAKEQKRGLVTYDSSIHQEFVEKINAILDDNELKEKLGSEGRKEIKEKYTLETIKYQYRDLFVA